jgi:hypothetical protein
MITDLPVSVEMPVGVDPANDFTAYVGAFSVETPFGLHAPSTGQELKLSPSLTLKIKAADPAPRLYAIVRGRLLYVPQSNMQPARLELQPLPFVALALSRRLPGSGAPRSVFYENVEPSSLNAAASALLKDVDKSKRQTYLTEFLAGKRWLSVSASAYIGRAAATGAPAGFRTVALSMTSQDGFLVNPAHYFYQFPTLNDKLATHPLLGALQSSQHDMRFAFKSGGRLRYVSKTSAGADGQFLTAATASKSIMPAISASAVGDIVVVLDTATYAEQIDIANGVQLASAASIGMPSPPSKSALLPKLIPPVNTTRAVSVASSNVGVSGFSLEGGHLTPGDGGGILVQEGTDIEVANNRITSNEAFRGAGVAVRRSNLVSVSWNRIEKNIALGTELFESVPANRGQGGGVFTMRPATSAAASRSSRRRPYPSEAIPSATRSHMSVTVLPAIRQTSRPMSSTRTHAVAAVASVFRLARRRLPGMTSTTTRQAAEVASSSMVALMAAWRITQLNITRRVLRPGP